jgi:outer membrane protein OmpA-like peptidoglycan-associated protein/ABC-type nitrate/sulfonate/bicarbonate transport system substrate-binding protein
MRLKPAGKAVVVLVVLCVAGALSWNLGLREIVQGKGGGGGASPGADGSGAAGSGASGGGTGAGEGGAGAAAPAEGFAGLGTAGNPLKVSIVSFHGYAPALLANGNSLKTQPGSIFEKNGVHVEFLLQDDLPTLATNFGSGTAHCSWRTIDFWAQEHPGLRGSGFDGKMVVIVDNTRGGDAVIARKGIDRVEDLANRKVALLQYTPSHWLLVNALDNSSLGGRKRQSVQMVFVNAEEGTPGVRAAFTAKQVDAAVLWEPDLSLALKAAPDAHVVYSTAIATNLVYDGMVCDTRAIDGSFDAVQGFVSGWLQGVDAAKKDPAAATAALVATEPFFAELQSQEGAAFIHDLYGGVLWTGLDDNLRVLGMADGPNHYERVYKQADQVWRAAGALADPNAPVIAPQDAFDRRFIEALAQKDAAAKAAAAKPEFTFSEKEQKEATKKTPTLTKPVSIKFNTASAELTKRAMQQLDQEVVPVLDAMGSAYFSVEGNTDGTGSRNQNVQLSKQRAEAVVAYLVGQWEFPRERFKVAGNGPDKAMCDENAPDSEGLTLDDCRAANRRTDVGVFSRQ